MEREHDFFVGDFGFIGIGEVCRAAKLTFSPVMKLIKDAKKAMALPGSPLDVFTALMCTQLQFRYEKLSKQERTVLKNVIKNSSI